MMTLDAALEIARNAKLDGRLNDHPKACIALAAEVERLRQVCAALEAEGANHGGK